MDHKDDEGFCGDEDGGFGDIIKRVDLITIGLIILGMLACLCKPSFLDCLIGITFIKFIW